MWRLERYLVEITGLPGHLAAARRRLAGRADRPDADARVLRRSRRGRAARHDHHGRHRARDEPGERHDGRLQAGEGRHRRARQPRPRGSAREGERANRRPDAHQPVHARSLRRGDRGGRGDLPRRRCAPLLRRSEPERRRRPLSTGRHGLRHRPHQPAQDVLAAARRRWARAAGRSPCGTSIEPFLPSPQVVRDGDVFRLDHDRPKSIGRVRGFAGAVRRLRPLVRLHARLRAGAARDVRGCGAERQLPAGAAARRRSSCRTTGTACTSSCSRRGT